LKKTFILLLLIFNNLFSQESSSAFIPQGLSLPLLNGYGISAIQNDVSNISAINPAALGNFEKVEFGFSYQYEGEIKEAWIAEIGSKRINNMIPQSVGFVFPFNNLNFAISMNQRYNSTLLLGEGEIFTPCNLDETSIFYNPKIETIIYNYAFSTSYKFENLPPKSEFSVGFRVGLNNLSENLDFYSASYNASIFGNDFSFGMLYSTNLTYNRNLSLGLYYQSPLEIKGTTKADYEPIPYCGTNGDIIYNASSQADVNLAAQFPYSLRFDLTFTQIEQFQFLFSISKSFWSKLDTYIRDQVEFSSSVSYFINKSLTFSVGFAKSEKEYVTNFMEINRNLEVSYFTAGSVFTIDDLSVNLSYADSHLSSGDFRKTRIGKLGLSYSF